MDNNGAILSSSIVVVFCAFFLVFSQEFIRFFKKIASNSMAILLLPLLFASLIVEIFQDWLGWLLITCRLVVGYFFIEVARLFPFQIGALYLSRILFLCVLACIPTWIFWLKVKYRGGSVPVIAFYIGAVLWIIGTYVLLIQP